jgi:hypothetical protein
MSRLVGMMNAYEPLHFSSDLGWQAAVPFSSDPPWLGTDAGTADEMLNTAYILASVFDALAIYENKPTLAARHPMATAMSAAMRFADSGGTIALPAISIASMQRQGTTTSMQSEGVGSTNSVLMGTPALGVAFADQGDAVVSNRGGGIYDANMANTNRSYFFRIRGQ